MPINARPEYFKAEGKYLIAQTNTEKIKALEEMLSVAPAHKGAENLRAGIKQKLAKLRALIEKERKSTGKGFAISVKKEGAAQVIFISMTNAGKSLLLSKLTNAKPEVAAYGYTTRMPEVGIMDHEGVNVQIVELPAVYEDYAYKGNGPTLFSIIRNADLIVFVIDMSKDTESQLKLLHSECEKSQLMLNKEKPPVKIRKVGEGGIQFVNTIFFSGDHEKAKKMLQENGFHNVIVEFTKKANIEDLAEALNEGLVYMPLLVVYNKADLAGKRGVSALTGEGIDNLKKEIWEKLCLVRVFTKTPGKPKDWPPVALKRGGKIKDLAMHIHKDFVKKFKFARVWGKSAKFDGQMQGLDHELEEGDIVEFHLK